MPDELRLLAGFALAAAAALAATPLAIAVATRTGFHDKPVGYKGHKAPTPYLGGAAVVGAFLAGGLTLGGELTRLAPIVALTLGLWCLGTLDDKVSLSPQFRLILESAAASVIWATDLGWAVTGSPVLDLLITNVWVIGVVNAFNLMDNMDGAAATVAAVTGVTVGVLGAIENDLSLAVLSLGLAGACLGFLPYNLSKPARIFLGDGGSLPIGFLVASVVMALPGGAGDPERLLAATILVGLPIIDTALVMVSRRRAGVPLLKGGRDHLTHRLVGRLGSPRSVALALAFCQGLLGAVAIGVVAAGDDSVIVAWSAWFVAAAGAIVLLETRGWAPSRAGKEVCPAGTPGTSASPRPPSLVEGVLITFVGLSFGVSPFLYGFYDEAVWGPIGLVLLAALLGLAIARPAKPRRTAFWAGGGLGGVWIGALASTHWAESAEQAMTEANRWLLYASLFGMLILLLRDDRLGGILIAAVTTAILGLAGYLIVRLIAGTGADLFFAGRLHEPLGYINGEAGYLLMGFWPLLAVAEIRRRPLVSGVAVAGAVLLVGLVVLGQTRAVVPAALVSTVVMLAVVPGRLRRLGLIVVVIAGVAVALGPLLDVYESADGQGRPTNGSLEAAGRMLLLAAVLSGVVWAVVMSVLGPLGERMIKRPRLALGGAAMIAVACALIVAISAVEDPLGRARDEYRSFVKLDSVGDRSTRFTSGSGNRYDYWRVAAGQFSAEPFRGIGAGNYDGTYFRDRRTREDVRQPHSLPLQTLAELGILGAAPLAVFLLSVFTGFWRRARSSVRSREDRLFTVAGGGLFVTWLVHTSVDWLHLIPGVTGLALCGAAVLVSPWRDHALVPAVGPRVRVRVAAVGVCALLVVVGAILLGRATLAERSYSQGQASLSKNPALAAERARASLALDDESVPALYLLSAAEARLGRYEPARAALLEAARREPSDFVTWALLGDLATRRGEKGAAARFYRRTRTLNPRLRGLKAASRESGNLP